MPPMASTAAVPAPSRAIQPPRQREHRELAAASCSPQGQGNGILSAQTDALIGRKHSRGSRSAATALLWPEKRLSTPRPPQALVTANPEPVQATAHRTREPHHFSASGEVFHQR